MKATTIHGPEYVRVEDVPDPVLEESTDAIVRITAAGICGSDLHAYAEGTPGRIGHEFLGVVEDVGPDVTTVERGDLVLAPFVSSDGTCEYCRAGLHTSCVRAGYFGRMGMPGSQAEAVRVPLADGTLLTLPVGPDDALIPSLLTLSDVFGTAQHAVTCGGVRPGSTVTVIGDGAVGLLAVLAAKRLGAARIVLAGRHRSRTDLGREFGATDVVTWRDDEGAAIVRDLTGGGSPIVVEAAGTLAAYRQAYGSVRPGGVISRVGAPSYEDAPIGFDSLFADNVRLAGGLAPTRAYMRELLPDVLDGVVEPGKVFDRTVSFDGIGDAYRAMAERSALKALLRP